MPCMTFWKRWNASKRSARQDTRPIRRELGAALARATSNRDHFRSEPRHSGRFDWHSPGDSMVTGARDRERPEARVPGLIGPNHLEGRYRRAAAPQARDPSDRYRARRMSMKKLVL